MLVKEGNRSVLGSKGFDLYRCVLLGVRVPDFVVVPIVAHVPGDEQKMAACLRNELSAALVSLGGLVSVRSSSVAEDLGNSSNAGQFKTVLNVGSLEDLENALIAVWGSSKGNPMAVIIQRMLRPDIAGVLFTRDPVSGASSYIIEYVEGLGDALVSGRKTPKRLVVADSKGLKAGHPLEKLVAMAKSLEEGFGYPLDIEWAQCEGELYILQARPITRLPPSDASVGQSYSRVHAEEFFSGPVSPLFFSVFDELYSKYYMGETLESLKVELPLKGPLMVRNKNHLYTATAPMEFLYSNLPSKTGDRRLQEVLPPDLAELLSKNKTSGPRKDLMRALVFLATNPKLWITNLDKHFHDKTVPEIVRRLDALEKLEDLDNEGLLRAHEELMAITAAHIRISKWGLVLYSIALTEIMGRFFKKNGIDENRLASLMVGLDDNRTLDATRELGGLAKAIRDVPVAVEVLKADHGNYKLYKEALTGVRGGELLVEHFGSILTRYGHRRLSRDLRAPSWGDDPMIPFGIVRSLVLEGTFVAGTSPVSGPKDRELALKDIEKDLSFGKRHTFRVLAKYFTRYIAFREFQRFYLDLILAKMRKVIVEIGARMQKAGVIDELDDVFFLGMEDLSGFVLGKVAPGLAKKAIFNKLSFEDHKGTPGRYLRGSVDFDAVEKHVEANISSGAIAGQPVSAGSYCGKVRVIEDLDRDIEMEEGDVLVTRCLDPGQTHFLMRAGALILEVGGMLSHGAILARELGIPTVAQVRNATGRFQDGQKVVVDGSKGTVTLEG
jgi:phosphohistidine swiveling domain-containing protein